jgi:hypothetical protein
MTLMKPDNTLTITSLLAIVLTTFHLTDDVVRGFEPGGLKNLTGIAILAAWLAATLLLVGRRSGYIVLLLGSLLAIGIPILHLSGKGVGGAIAASPGGYFFIWTLFALGVTGALSLILSARGLWRLRRVQPGA